MLSQTAIYAIRAMGYLAGQDTSEPVLSSLIADKMEIPQNFLSKILNRLSQARLIETTRGRNGGVKLARPATEIKLHDIVNHFMTVDDYKKCMLGLNQCDGSCGLHLRWRIISEQYDKILNETTIDQVF